MEPYIIHINENERNVGRKEVQQTKAEFKFGKWVNKENTWISAVDTLASIKYFTFALRALEWHI